MNIHLTLITIINFNHYTDEELFILLKQGDKRAFDQIYDRFWKRLFLTAYKRIKSLEDSKDLVQDLFASLWLKRETIEIRQTVAAYLFTAIKYKVINYIESHIVRENYLKVLKKTVEDYDNSTNEKIYSHDLQNCIDQGINTLSPKVKEVFELSRNENLSIKEIASKLNVSDQTVKNQISKALKTLKLHLNQLLSLVIITNFL
ncbi:MAG TPA: RNA polymerase sigma-70 factor [Cytophagales bacterium]|nr:RNA polymerase sigma-70 factor [Cytophagales bacterium]